MWVYLCAHVLSVCCSGVAKTSLRDSKALCVFTTSVLVSSAGFRSELLFCAWPQHQGCSIIIEAYSCWTFSFVWLTSCFAFFFYCSVITSPYSVILQSIAHNAIVAIKQGLGTVEPCAPKLALSWKIMRFTQTHSLCACMCAHLVACLKVCAVIFLLRFGYVISLAFTTKQPKEQRDKSKMKNKWKWQLEKEAGTQWCRKVKGKRWLIGDHCRFNKCISKSTWHLISPYFDYTSGPCCLNVTCLTSDWNVCQADYRLLNAFVVLWFYFLLTHKLDEFFEYWPL